MQMSAQLRELRDTLAVAQTHRQGSQLPTPYRGPAGYQAPHRRGVSPEWTPRELAGFERVLAAAERRELSDFPAEHGPLLGYPPATWGGAQAAPLPPHLAQHPSFSRPTLSCMPPPAPFQPPRDDPSSIEINGRKYVRQQ